MVVSGCVQKKKLKESLRRNNISKVATLYLENYPVREPAVRQRETHSELASLTDSVAW